MDKKNNLINDSKRERPAVAEDHSHAWKAAWNRPMKIDERGLHPFTVARMTDHNVKGRD